MRLLATLLCLLATPALAAVSPPAEGQHVTMRLITAEDGVAGTTLSAGLAIELDPGWKTYWRSPGEVGLPPELDWQASSNVAGVDLAFPAPERFTAFEIENYGYSDAVTYPLAVRLDEAGAATRLDVTANLLVCAEICIPETLTVALDLPPGGGVDAASAATLADWVGRVPGQEGFTLDAVHLDGAALTLTATSEAPLTAPVVFPEQEGYAAFGPPETRVSADGTRLWARLPVTSPGEGPLQLTLVDGPRAATLPAPDLAAAAPAPPDAGAGLWRILLIAMLGGLILNAMPCVLPVLSIKLASALQARDRALGEVRAGFLAAAAGVLVFFAALAGAVIAARGAGMAVGWGVQFQQPVFLALMVGLMALFAANLVGLFEIRLPARFTTAMGTAGGTGRLGDFATGAFAAVMATPCSAPFIGSAVAYALTRSAGETLAVFLAMGTGLALPYLAVAARPSVVRRLPRPGAWMRTVRIVLGVLMLLTALWLVTVLAASAGWNVALAVAGAVAAMLALLAWRRAPGRIGAAGLVVAMATALFVPPATPRDLRDDAWAPFAPAAIAQAVAEGEVVFVDITAEWCLTCKANKRLVLDREAVRDALDGTLAMQGDWTRPDEGIAAYLRSKGRYGIPFNAVYGPGTPDGVALPEILTEASVLDAIAKAGSLRVSQD